MTTLILARHGRSTSNTAGTLAGRTRGISLDETGQSQAMRLGERLRGLTLAAVVCSPMDRCRETAQLALDSAGIDVPVSIDERVIESDYGDWSGRPLKDLASEPLWKLVQSKPSEVTFPGGEAMLNVQRRMIEAIDDWNARLGADAVWLCVSHGDPIAAALSAALHQDFDDYQRIAVDPASASVVIYPAPPPDQPADGGIREQPVPRPRVATMNSVAGQLAAFVPKRPEGPDLGGGLGAAGGGDEQQPPAPRPETA